MKRSSEAEVVLHQTLSQFPDAYAAYLHGVAHPEESEAPGASELADYWHDTYGSTTQPADVVYGVVRPTGSERPWALASVDLCEVVRETAGSTLRLGGFTLDQLGEQYSYAAPFGLNGHESALSHIVRTIMVRGEITPVAGIETIKDTLQVARNSGVYVVANTATLEGCEVATVDWLAEHLPDCFDGIVFPRNHFGSSQGTTKGSAALSVLAGIHAIDRPDKVAHTVHVDDAAHHIHAVRASIESLRYGQHTDFTPRYNWNRHDASLNLSDTPLDSFLALATTLDDWSSGQRLAA